MIYALNNTISFPDPRDGEPSGLFAVGGELSPARLQLAYSNGIFPWFPFKYCDEPEWYCPMQRFVIFPSEIHISHSMRTLMNKHRYAITFDADFDGVIHRCADLRIHEEGAWLGLDMIHAYTILHRQDWAHSVEVWDGRNLVGGLYGVQAGRVFVGESMFSLVPSASKLALTHLAQMLQQVEGTLIDCQFETPHLRSMGGRFISYDEYLRILHNP